MNEEVRMEFRKAALADLTGILPVYRDAIRHMDEMGIHQWDEIYPNAGILEEDIRNKEMYLGLIGSDIASVFVLNPKHDPEYEAGAWQYGSLRYSVVHRLCVNPACQNKGIGTQTMLAAEDILRKGGIEAVRLDAFAQNPAALRLYTRLGYQKVGEVVFRKGLFYLFEKKL